jgi:O-antigen/teichoic acid export membrane protein
VTTTENEPRAIDGSSSQAKNESQHITRGIGSLSIQNVATSALGFIYLAVLLRLLPGIDYGVYSALSVSVGIGAVVAPMGLQYAAAKYLADVQDRAELRSRAKKIILISTVTSLAAGLIFAILAGDLSLYFTKSPIWSGAFVIGGIWLSSSSLSSVVQGTVQGLKRYTSLAGMLFVARAVMLGITIAGLEITHDLYVSFYAWIIYFGLLIFWSFRILSNDVSQRTEFSTNTLDQSLGYQDLLKYSLPLGIAGIFYVLTTNVDLLVVGGDMNPTSLGVYNTVVSISNVLNFVLITPLVTALLPEASYRIRNSSEISNGMRLAIRFAALLVLPTSLLMAALSPQLLALFSGSYKFQSGAEPLEIIAMFYVFFALQFVIYSILQAKGNTVQVFGISVISALTIYSLSVVLVPELGLVGASIARSVSAIAGMGVAWYIARDFLRSLDRSSFYLKASLAALIPFGAIWELTMHLSQAVWTIFPYALLAGLIFLADLYMLKVLNEEDLAYFSSVLPSWVSRKLRAFARQKANL